MNKQDLKLRLLDVPSERLHRHIAQFADSNDVSDEETLLLSVFDEDPSLSFLDKITPEQEGFLTRVFDGFKFCRHFTNTSELEAFCREILTTDQLIIIKFGSIGLDDLDEINDIWGATCDDPCPDYDSFDELLFNFLDTSYLIDYDIYENAYRAQHSRELYLRQSGRVNEALTIDEKKRKLAELDDVALRFLYVMLVGDYTEPYSPEMRTRLDRELELNPQGKLSQYLDPLTETPAVDADKQVRDFYAQYGINETFEAILESLIDVFPVPDVQRLLCFDRPFSYLFGLDGTAYCVSGAYYENLKKLN